MTVSLCAMMAEKPLPSRVLYCSVCGLPVVYGEFGPDFKRQRPCLQAHATGVYPDELIVLSSSGGGGVDYDLDKVGEHLQVVEISDCSSSAAVWGPPRYHANNRPDHDCT